MMFDVFNNKRIITGVITAIDPIHIGSSMKDSLDPTQVDSAVIKDADGKPLIPGSSLKGVIRSDFEAVLRSVGKTACDVFDNNDISCVTNEYLSSIMKKNDMTNMEKAKDLYDKSCCACRLFGGKAIASKIQFKDCSFIGEKCIYEYRDGVGIDRETGAARGGAKYDFEIVPKGTKFDFYMTAENLDEEQEKYLNYILKRLKSGEIAVGGKTTRGLGRIKLDNVKIDPITVDKLFDELGVKRGESNV